jgi:RNA polymerase sigma factor (TIGR02999 family)
MTLSSARVNGNPRLELQWLKDFFNRMGPKPGTAQITALIRAWGDGDATALDRLTPLVYNELRRMARRYMRSQRAGQTLQTTALVHEAYLHLMDAKSSGWRDRAHFFAVSAQIMRRILIDAARARGAQKRGGAAERVDHSTPVDLDMIADVASERGAELLRLEDALAELERMDPRKAKVVELRFYAGLSVEEAAAVLKVSPQTVLRDWRLARVWLARELASS